MRRIKGKYDIRIFAASSLKGCLSFFDFLISMFPLLMLSLLFLWSTPTYAALSMPQMPEIMTVLKNINNQLPMIWRFVTGLTYVAGFWCAFRAMYEAKEYGELRMMMATHTDARKMLTEMVVAVILLYWPSLVNVMVQSTFGAPILYSYQFSSQAGQQYRDMYILAGNIVQLIGFVAFIRGWLILTNIVTHGGQPGMFGKGMTHIVAGLLAINIFGTWKILESLFGLS